MLIALTRAVPPSIAQCELTHLEPQPIDYARAVTEHAAYEDALRRAGCQVERLPDLPGNPDSVFVEDTAVVFDGVAVMARPGALSRRGEVESTARALERYRPLARIQPPATLDGGDVLVTPGLVFVGVSGRTNADGARQLATILAAHGIRAPGPVHPDCPPVRHRATRLPESRLAGAALSRVAGAVRPPLRARRAAVRQDLPARPRPARPGPVPPVTPRSVTVQRGR